MKKLGVVFPLVLVVIALCWIPYTIWNDMTEGLLVFLGLLVAALVQVIPVTANFLQSDSLTIDEAKQLTWALERQQQYWLGLLWVSIVTSIALIIGKALPETAVSFSFSVSGITFEPSLQAFYSGLVGGLLGLVIVKAFGIFPGVLSLQKLRGDLVINAAKRRQAETVHREAAARQQVVSIVDSDYGKIIPPPH